MMTTAKKKQTIDTLDESDCYVNFARIQTISIFVSWTSVWNANCFELNHWNAIVHYHKSSASILFLVENFTHQFLSLFSILRSEVLLLPLLFSKMKIKLIEIDRTQQQRNNNTLQIEGNRKDLLSFWSRFYSCSMLIESNNESCHSSYIFVGLHIIALKWWYVRTLSRALSHTKHALSLARSFFPFRFFCSPKLCTINTGLRGARVNTIIINNCSNALIHNIMASERSFFFLPNYANILVCLRVFLLFLFVWIKGNSSGLFTLFASISTKYRLNRWRFGGFFSSLLLHVNCSHSWTASVQLADVF